MQSGLVSVIIPAYNAAAFIAEALDSVLAQTWSPIEIIVVDDGSTDATAEIVRGYGERVRLLQQPNSGGCAVPRNTGMRVCSGEFLCYFDADDVLVPTKIAEQVAFMREHPGVGLLYSDYRNFTDEADGRRVEERDTHFATCARLLALLDGRSSVLLDSTQATALLLEENIGLPSSVMIRRSVLASVPEFSTVLKSCEDFHFFYRVARQYEVGVIANVGLLRRIHGSNMSGNQRKMLQYQIMSRAELLATESRPHNARRLEDYLSRRELDLARVESDQGAPAAAMGHLWRALTLGLPGSLRHLGAAAWLFLRTLSQAMGIRRVSASGR